MLFKKTTDTAPPLAAQVFSEGIYFGILKTASPVRIEGNFKGIIFCSNKVIISKNATVYGDIICHEIAIAGLIEGNVLCKKKCTLEEDAVVNGIIRTATFENAQNSSVLGALYVNKENKHIDIDKYYTLLNKKEHLDKIQANYFSLPQEFIFASDNSEPFY